MYTCTFLLTLNLKLILICTCISIWFKYNYFLISFHELIGKFKSTKAFNWLAMQHARRNVTFLWDFFESGHGKGEHDGEGACINHVLWQHELAGTYVYTFSVFLIYL